ncbi:MAG: MarR family winged helix-turn-helix transcriptional regulator [Kiritimatiellaeota bacterium]|nr:MarR family winged helix-turn-helix transcriptional regulator [Kiritimatiellota bacterium]
MKKAELSLEQFAARLVALMPRLSRGVTQHARNNVALGTATLPQLWALEHLFDGGPCTMRALAAELHLQGSTATGLVDQLERRGLVARRRDRQDRRVVQVTLSVKGRRCIEQMRDKKRITLMRGFGRHSLTERASFLESVEKLVLGLAAPAPAADKKDTL